MVGVVYEALLFTVLLNICDVRPGLRVDASGRVGKLSPRSCTFTTCRATHYCFGHAGLNFRAANTGVLANGLPHVNVRHGRILSL